MIAIQRARPYDVLVFVQGAVAAAFSLLLLGALLVGCGASVQGVLSAQASAIVSARGDRVAWYEERHGACLEGAETMEAYQDCMAPARHVARAVDSYREALHAAQAAVDVSGADGAVGSITCVIEAAQATLRALDVANAPIPAEIWQIAALVPGGSCDVSH